MLPSTRSSGRLRRYPALGFLVVAAILASLLPSSLRVPLSGPSATAEIAPVPGESDNSDGDLSSLEATSTEGLGSGLGTGGSGSGEGSPPPPPPPPPNRGGNPVQKKCVGKPGNVKQTEDPLSPACVAHFKGDNFGATWAGVTRDEVRVVIYASCNPDGTFSVIDVNERAWEGWHWPELLRYFNERFQTYGRRVKVYVTNTTSGQEDGDCVDNGPMTKAVVQGIKERVDPFYIGMFYDGLSSEVLSQEAARLKIMSHSYSPVRDFANANAPYVVAYDPDVEASAAAVVGLVCNALAGRPAKWGESADTAKQRKFGLNYNRQSDASSVGADLIRRGISQRCGDKAGAIETGAIGRAPEADDMARLRAAGVTTLLWISPGIPLYQNVAGNWRPEVILLNNERVGRNDTARAFSSALSTTLGLMLDRRRGSFNEQPEKNALRESCPECFPNAIDIGIYNKLMLLFTGIQAAGPRLTPANFERGLRSLPPHPPDNPFVPTAYFGPGDHSFVKDFALTWWDPAGDPPGENPAPGCWRLVDEGQRFRPEDWAERQGGDEEFFQRVPAQVCQGEQ